MPVQLPPKDIWDLYRTAVLKYPLRSTKADGMKHDKTVKEYLWWQCPGCLGFWYVPVDLGQPLCPFCMRQMMKSVGEPFFLDENNLPPQPPIKPPPNRRQ